MFEVVTTQVQACNVISKYWRYRFKNNTLLKLIEKIGKRGIRKSALKKVFCAVAKRRVFHRSNVRLIHELMVRIVVLAMHFVDRHLLDSFELKVGYFASAYLYSLFPAEVLFNFFEGDERDKLVVEKAGELIDCFESICEIILEKPRTECYFSADLVHSLQKFLALVSCFHHIFDQWRPVENERISQHAKENAKLFYQYCLWCPTPYLRMILKKYSEKVVQMESKEVLEENLSSVDRYAIFKGDAPKKEDSKDSKDTKDAKDGENLFSKYYPIPMFYYNVLHALNTNCGFQLKDNGSSTVDPDYFWMYSVDDMFSVSEMATSLSSPIPKYSYLIQMLVKIQEIFNLYFFHSGIFHGSAAVHYVIQRMHNGTFRWEQLYGILKKFALELYHTMQIYAVESLENFEWDKVMSLKEGGIPEFCELFFQLFECLHKIVIHHVNSEARHLKGKLEIENVQREKILFDKIFPKSISRTIFFTQSVLDRYEHYHIVLNMDGNVSKDISMIQKDNLQCVYFFHCSLFLEMWSHPKLECASCPETLRVDWKQLEIMRKQLYTIILKAHLYDNTHEFLKTAKNCTTGAKFSKEEISKVYSFYFFKN